LRQELAVRSNALESMQQQAAQDRARAQEIQVKFERLDQDNDALSAELVKKQKLCKKPKS
jgi:hypothetical protein